MINPIQKPITGLVENVNANNNEVAPEIYGVLNSFYTAFNGRDIQLMEGNWLKDETIAMDNPLGGIKRGWDEIKAVYEKIFSGDAVVYVEFYDYTIVDFEGGFCAIGRERGLVNAHDSQLDLAIRTSRVYIKTRNGYKQVHHHGSITDPKMLEQYQELVK